LANTPDEPRGPAAPKRDTKIQTQAPATKQKMVLLFFESLLPAHSLKRVLARFSAEVAHTVGNRCVAVIQPDGGTNPVALAVQAAFGLVAQAASTRVVVELAAVSIHPRPDGSRRFLSALFQSSDYYRPADVQVA